MPVKKRFPTMAHLVSAGLITEQELEAYDAIKSPYTKYWLPIRWALQVATTARMEKRIASEFLYDKIVDVGEHTCKREWQGFHILAHHDLPRHARRSALVRLVEYAVGVHTGRECSRALVLSRVSYGPTVLRHVQGVHQFGGAHLDLPCINYLYSHRLTFTFHHSPSCN
jgi:hypothetical protein